MFKSILNFTTGTIYFVLFSIAVVWGLYGGFVFYNEYISPPTASISQSKIDAIIAKSNADEEKARQRMEEIKKQKN